MAKTIDSYLNKDGTWKDTTPKVTDSFMNWERPVGNWLSDTEPMDAYDMEMGVQEFKKYLASGRAKQRTRDQGEFDLEQLAKTTRQTPERVWRALVNAGNDIYIRDLEKTVKDLDGMKRIKDLTTKVIVIRGTLKQPSVGTYLHSNSWSNKPQVLFEFFIKNKSDAITKKFSAGLDGLYEAISFIEQNAETIVDKKNLPIANKILNAIDSFIDESTSSDDIQKMGSTVGLSTLSRTPSKAKILNSLA